MLETDFYFNGEKSVDKGVYLVSMQSGLLSTPFSGGKQLLEETISGRDAPYFYGVQKEPLTLTLTLSTMDNAWTYEKRREIARWLDTDNFELFYTVDYPYKWYYCQYVDGIDLNYNEVMRGYIDVKMRCDSRYAYSPVIEKEYTINSSEPVNILFENAGDIDLKPQMWIKMLEDGDVTIKNNTVGRNKIFKFTGLKKDEEVYVDNKNEHIATSLDVSQVVNEDGELEEIELNEIFRYDNFNDNYLSLIRGTNELAITGRCNIIFRWQYKILGG